MRCECILWQGMPPLSLQHRHQQAHAVPCTAHIFTMYFLVDDSYELHPAFQRKVQEGPGVHRPQSCLAC